jgi:hypothetical protein
MKVPLPLSEAPEAEVTSRAELRHASFNDTA